MIEVNDEAESLPRALDRWLEIQGELLRGVAHAMSNRIGTMSAGVFMLEDNAANTKAVAALRSEVDQIEVHLGQLRLLPRAAHSLEPMLASDIARSAIELHAHHGDLRHVTCVLDDPGTIPPVRADPGALLHALLIVLTCAKQAATSGATTIRLVADTDIVTFDVLADIADGQLRFALEVLAATHLLAASGGRAVAHASGCRVEVPTLASSRRRSS